MVIDDNEDAVEVMVLLMQAEGWHAVGTCDPDTAASLAEAHTPDVVITDLQMPGADGGNVARSVRAVLPLVQVWVATGADWRDVQPLVDSGLFDRMLRKPLDADSLLLQLRQVRGDR